MSWMRVFHIFLKPIPSAICQRKLLFYSRETALVDINKNPHIYQTTLLTSLHYFSEKRKLRIRGDTILWPHLIFFGGLCKIKDGLKAKRLSLHMNIHVLSRFSSRDLSHLCNPSFFKLELPETEPETWCMQSTCFITELRLLQLPQYLQLNLLAYLPYTGGPHIHRACIHGSTCPWIGPTPESFPLPPQGPLSPEDVIDICQWPLLGSDWVQSEKKSHFQFLCEIRSHINT